ncbi:HalOD1 output domain-containing protein [Saliphagus sp. LR7]|uniref:HalOD1 output domain-containing protein n=1 Tax=Saliphagus sp. LR7 TaxID=2282654 RepID=UPI000DF7C8F7|nr:HalOD1 output domain-containing protein [Saliphagus sp. LR7]
MDTSTQLHRTNLSESDPVYGIIESLADVENTSPSELSTELGGPLWDYIDPGALESLVTQSRDVTISFAVDSYQLKIDGEELTIYENS